MSTEKEKYIGESLIREEPGKKLKLRIGDKVIKTKHLDDACITPDKFDESVEKLFDKKADLINGKVPSEQLPSYVDDVINGYYYNGSFYQEATHITEITGEERKIYVDIPTGESYRWSGFAYILISNPYSVDEEDLTVVNNNIKFKDRPNTSGMGRVILRKNIVSEVNTLTQSMINQQNTIYVIQYDFTLGEDITVPANCVLEFDGGSISGNKTLTGTNTDINAGLVKIFNTDITLAGTWNVVEAYPEWFGAKGDGASDDAIFINACIYAFNKAILTKQNYYTQNTIQLKAKSVLESKTKNTTINYNGSGDCVKFAKAATESIVRNISFVGDYTTYESNNTIGLHFDDTEAGRGILLDNIFISSFNTGIKAKRTLWSSYITNCKYGYCNIQLDIYEALNIHISGCYFSTPSNCCCSLEAARCISFVNCNFGCENIGGSRFFNIYSTSTCTFTDCNFEVCYVNSANGAANVQGGSVVTMNNCRFHQIKRADSYAGSCIIFYIAGTNAVNLTLINCMFYDNGDGVDYRLYYFFVHAAHHRVYLSGNRKTKEGLADSSFTVSDVYSPDNTVFQEVVTKTLGT